MVSPAQLKGSNEDGRQVDSTRHLATQRMPQETTLTLRHAIPYPRLDLGRVAQWRMLAPSRRAVRLACLDPFLNALWHLGL